VGFLGEETIQGGYFQSEHILCEVSRPWMPMVGSQLSAEGGEQLCGFDRCWELMKAFWHHCQAQKHDSRVCG